MRRHILLKKKISVANNFPWYAKLSNEQVSNFSLIQLEKLSEILNESEKFRESCNPWYTLDVNRAIRKSVTGEPEIIVEIEGSTVKTLTSDEIKATVANSIYNKYNKEKNT